MGESLQGKHGWSWLIVGGLLLSAVNGRGQSESNAAPEQRFETLAEVEDKAVLNWARELGKEERRYLMYLYGRLNRPKVTEQLARDILADDPGNKNALLLLASMYVEQQDRVRALHTADQLVRYYPEDDQALYFAGAARWMAGQYGEANRIFRELKIEQFPRKKFPYTTDLASSALLAGDWYRAMLAYQELLRHHDLGNELRDQVRIVLDDIYRTYLPQLASRYQLNLLDFGRLNRLNISYEHQLNDSKRLFVDYKLDELSLDRTPIFRASNRNRHQVQTKLATVHSSRWDHELSLGGYGEGLFFGGRLIRKFTPQRKIAFYARGFERATDSLIFELLDGRQHRVGVDVQYQFEDEWFLTLDAAFRQSVLDEDVIGDGYLATWTIEKLLFSEAPEVRVGYRGTRMQFWHDLTDLSFIDPYLVAGISAGDRQLTATQVVNPLVHRHGMFVTVRDNLADAWKYRVTVGGDYVDEQDLFAYGGEAEIAFWPRKSIELTTGIAYSSSASTSDSASELWQLNFGFRYYF